MPTRIFKYPLIAQTAQYIEVPMNAHAVSAQLQSDQVCLWAEVDPDQERVITHAVYLIGTGDVVPVEARRFLSTVQVGAYVFHVYTDGF